MNGADRHSLLLSLALCLLPAGARADDTLPPILSEVGYDQRLNQQVPLDLEFRDETGNNVRLGSYFNGKPVVLVLAYYRCPMLCTQVLNGVLEAAKGMTLEPGDDYQIVTVSFDPRERPVLAAAKKAHYLADLRRPHAEQGWHFLTGEQEPILRLTEAVGFRYRFDPKQEQFAHASGIIVLTPQGKVARYFFGVDYPQRDLRLGLVEASEGKIGTPIDRVLLFCYHYDPAVGKYTPVVQNLMRLGGVVTILVMGGLIGLALVRERRRQKTPRPRGGEGQG
jgi:protein SCO1/2